ncbi:MAG: LysM peptidoglycan-binding domain-containing protein [bacterium]
MSNEKFIRIETKNRKSKYDNTKRVDYSQHDPKEMKTINFKQDYVVMIRKKLFYAATAQYKDPNIDPDENYIRVYQINNFINVRTSHNVHGRPGSCSVSIKGGERIICAEKKQQGDANWESWQQMLSGWLSINNENEEWRTIDGKTYKTLMKAREAKYGWKYAEKCDWEPMDEIYVFGKSKHKKSPNGEYEFLPLFFGYIDSIQKTYQAGQGGMLISVQATDHLKLLQLSKVLNYPSIAPGKFANGGIDIRFPEDQFGCFMVNDPFEDIKKEIAQIARDGGDMSNVFERYGGSMEGITGQNDQDNENSSEESTNNNSNEEQQDIVNKFGMYLLTNVFAGEYPYIIIRSLAKDAGIPNKYLTKRIEQIRQVPFVQKIRQGPGDFFNAEVKSRLGVCQNAAEKLFLEFFADEAGDIVLKIPNWALGGNKKLANNMNNQELTNKVDELWKQLGYEKITNEDIKNDENLTNPDETEQNETENTFDPNKYEKITYVVQAGDTLSSIGRHQLNTFPERGSMTLMVQNNISDANVIYIGQEIEYYDIDYNNHQLYIDMMMYIKGSTSDEERRAIIENEIKNTKSRYLPITYKVRNPLSKKTDKYIPEVKPEYIISFTLIDTDREIYNMFEVQAEVPVLDLNGFEVIRRVVPDMESIVQFGLRPHPGVTNTPLISSAREAEVFGTIMIIKSLSKRYSGSLNMIEDSSIRVGDPIRLHMYDEHPFKELYERGTPYDMRSKNKKAQAVFYVNAIERSISPQNTSHMTLTLEAGRVMGQQSIFDVSYPIYRSYFDEKYHPTLGNNPDGKEKQSPPYTEIVITPELTISKILERYGDVPGKIPNNQEKIIQIMKDIVDLNPHIFGTVTDYMKWNIMNEQLIPDWKLKIPNR